MTTGGQCRQLLNDCDVDCATMRRAARAMNRIQAQAPLPIAWRARLVESEQMWRASYQFDRGDRER